MYGGKHDRERRKRAVALSQAIDRQTIDGDDRRFVLIVAYALAIGCLLVWASLLLTVAGQARAGFASAPRIAASAAIVNRLHKEDLHKEDRAVVIKFADRWEVVAASRAPDATAFQCQPTSKHSVRVASLSTHCSQAGVAFASMGDNT